MSSPSPPSRSRRLAFAALAAVCLLVAVGFVALTAASQDDDSTGQELTLPAQRAAGPTVADGAQQANPDSLPPAGIVFQHVKRDDAYAHMALTSADGGAARRITRLVCERAHFAGGRGLCLMSKQGVTGAEFDAQLVDERFRVVEKRALSGILSRARVSPDGRYGATTAFVAGHSYADVGKFSTSTHILEMAGGADLGNLEDFEVTDRGRVVKDEDRNFWGVTFARDSDRFYATLGTRRGTWLIEGSVRDRKARTLHRNVECPSLSPDGKRIAYKKKVNDEGVIWRLYVLDLQTMQETPTSERELVDDQAEWLDEDTLLYAKSSDVWSVSADGTGPPRKLLPDALSPAVLRG